MGRLNGHIVFDAGEVKIRMEYMREALMDSLKNDGLSECQAISFCDEFERNGKMSEERKRQLLRIR